MKFPLTSLVMAGLLGACSGPLASTSLPSGINATGSATDALGGLPDAEAAHASCRSERTDAFALSSRAGVPLLGCSRTTSCLCARPLPRALRRMRR